MGGTTGKQNDYQWDKYNFFHTKSITQLNCFGGVFFEARQQAPRLINKQPIEYSNSLKRFLIFSKNAQKQIKLNNT